MSDKSLYERLGGYDGINAFVCNLLPRVQADPQLGRFWQHIGTDHVDKEKQLLIDYLCNSAGGPVYYMGRDMKRTHAGLNINESDWQLFLGHAGDTLAELQVPQQECDEVVTFALSLKKDIVES